MTFCTDVDLLHWEPNIFRDAEFASQVLLSGSGDLAGTTFTLDAGSLTDAHVAPNHVILLAGGTSGAYPIVGVTSATQLTLSVLYDALFPASGSPDPSPVGTANDLTFVIRTFSPQARVISTLLRQAAGLAPDASAEDSAAILNPSKLRRPCSLGTLQMIYSAMSAIAPDHADLKIRADLYQRLFRRSLESAIVEVDLDGDGIADSVRSLGMLKFTRC